MMSFSVLYKISDMIFRKYDPDWIAGNFDAWSWKLGEFNSMLTLLVVGTSFVMYFFTDSNFIRPRAMGKAISPTPTGSRKLFNIISKMDNMRILRLSSPVRMSSILQC